MRLAVPLLRMLQRARGDQRGIAALEFALIAPVLLVLYMGGTDATMAVTLHRKLQDTAGTVSDLATQNETITNAELKGITNVARDIIRPYPVDRLGLLVQGVNIDASGKATVSWAFAQNATAPKKGSSYTLGSEYQGVKSTFLVVSSAQYSFQPIGGYGFTDGIPMDGESVFRARSTKGVQCTDC